MYLDVFSRYAAAHGNVIQFQSRLACVSEISATGMAITAEVGVVPLEEALDNMQPPLTAPLLHQRTDDQEILLPAGCPPLESWIAGQYSLFDPLAFCPCCDLRGFDQEPGYRIDRLKQ
jgi:hypothetical protein